METTVAQLLSSITEKLAPITETPRLEAELLLAHASGLSRASLLARLKESVPTNKLETLLARRLNCEPLAYIFGEWEFFGMSMRVVPPLLVPRPETEHLVSAVLDYLSLCSAPYRVIDVCCGTGCVGIAIARHFPDTSLYAVDRRQDALEISRENAQRYSISLQAICGDLLSPFTAPVDVIVANPPYVPEKEWETLSPVITRHEDPGALLAGEDGLDYVRLLIPAAADCLRSGGMLALEIGESHYAAVADLYLRHGFHRLNCHKDLAGIDRVITGLRL